MKGIFQFLCIFLILQCCAPTENQEKLKVYVAASLTPVLSELGQAFEDQEGIPITLNTASSGTLARQISQGAPADVFISANQQWIEFLDMEQLLKAPNKLPFKNQLVLIAPANASQNRQDLTKIDQIDDLLSTGKLAMGDPNHVPVGQYAVQAMKALNWQVQSSQTLQAKDARATLVAVELGEAKLGIVYQTDAEKSVKAQIIGTFPEEAYPPIHYFAGHCSDNPWNSKFMAFLSSSEASWIWEKYGFIR